MYICMDMCMDTCIYFLMEVSGNFLEHPKDNLPWEVKTMILESFLFLIMVYKKETKMHPLNVLGYNSLQQKKDSFQ